MRKAMTKTLAHLLGAMTNQHAVTIRYEKPVGEGVEVSRRRIEIHSVSVTKKGDITIRAWDHRDQEMTTFRVDRITHYTLHRSAKLASYAWPVVAADQDATIDDDTDEIVGFTAWTAEFDLAA